MDQRKMSTLAVSLVSLVFLLALVVIGATASAVVSEKWSRTFGGPEIDVGTSVQQTSDGGYIVTGYTRSFAGAFEDVLTIKTDSQGNEQWSNTYGGSSWDNGYCVRGTRDGGYVMTGFTRSYGVGWEDVWLIKTDAHGAKEWDRSFGGPESDWGFWVEQTPDDGYIIAGFTRSYGAGQEDAWLVRADCDGNQLWSRVFGGPDADHGLCVQCTSEGGYILAGRTESYGAGGSDAWLVKTDSDGNREWDRTFGGPGDDWICCVQQASDGGYVLTGSTQASDTDNVDLWLIKTDPDGNPQWDRTFGGLEWDEGSSVECTSDGGYVVVGWTSSYGAGDEDAWLLKTDSRGIEMWNLTFGGPDWDRGRAVQQTLDDGYIIVGSTQSFGAGRVDAWLIKVDASPEQRPFPYRWVGVGVAGIAVLACSAMAMSRLRKAGKP